MNTETNLSPNTPAYHTERDALPPELRDHFDFLVNMYRYYAILHHAHPFVSYKILADLIREGWRPSAKPMAATQPDQQ